MENRGRKMICANETNGEAGSSDLCIMQEKMETNCVCIVASTPPLRCRRYELSVMKSLVSGER